MFEFDKFQEEVLNAYFRKKAARELPSQLVTLKRANLRNYIRGRVARGYDKKDDAVLKEYFNPENEFDSLNESIHRFDIDKFRPLISYLKLETTCRNDNISKLLAWLIDFEPRPFEEWHKAREQDKDTDNGLDSGGEEAGPGTGEVEGGSTTIREVIVFDPTNEGPNGGANDGDRKGEVKDESTSPEPPVRKPAKPIWIIVIVMTTVLVIGALFIIYIYEPKQYMYWDGQKFIASSSKEEYSGFDLVPLNEYKLNHFRKIMRPDTLDRDDEKKVWYSKIDNKVEFFTMPGLHPVKRDRSLKAATKVILDKYAGNNASPVYQ